MAWLPCACWLDGCVHAFTPGGARILPAHPLAHPPTHPPIRAGTYEPLLTARDDFAPRVRMLMHALGGDLLERMQEDRAEARRWVGFGWGWGSVWSGAWEQRRQQHPHTLTQHTRARTS